VERVYKGFTCLQRTQQLLERTRCVNEESVRNSVVRMVTRYVDRGPYLLNPDRVVAENIINGLVRNKKRYGHAYCPCREVAGITEKDRDNICPCRSHKEEIARQGTCECGLFVSEAYLEAKQLGKPKS